MDIRVHSVELVEGYNEQQNWTQLISVVRTNLTLFQLKLDMHFSLAEERFPTCNILCN